MVIKFMWVKRDVVTHTKVFLCLFCVTYNPFKSVQLWRNYDMFDKVAQHHSPGFIMSAQALRTITVILFFNGLDTQQLPYIYAYLLKQHIIFIHVINKKSRSHQYTVKYIYVHSYIQVATLKSVHTCIYLTMCRNLNKSMHMF